MERSDSDTAPSIFYYAWIAYSDALFYLSTTTLYLFFQSSSIFHWGQTVLLLWASIFFLISYLIFPSIYSLLSYFLFYFPFFVLSSFLFFISSFIFNPFLVLSSFFFFLSYFLSYFPFLILSCFLLFISYFKGLLGFFLRVKLSFVLGPN